MTAFLSIRSGPQVGRRFPLDPESPVHIGRGSTCEVMLTDPRSSRFHAVMFYDDGDWHIRDKSSRNGTLVNDQKIDEARLPESSQITIGDTRMVVERVVRSSEDDGDAPTLNGEPVDPGVDPRDQLVRSGDLAIELYCLAMARFRGEGVDPLLGRVAELLSRRTGYRCVEVFLADGAGRLRRRHASPSDGENGEVPRARPPRGEAAMNGEGEDAVVLADMAGSDNVRGHLRLSRPDPDVIGEPNAFGEDVLDVASAAARFVAALIFDEQTTGSSSRPAKPTAGPAGGGEPDADDFIGDSPPMKQLRSRIARVAPAGGAVLIRGESGSGKELVARSVHAQGRRADRPMLTVNCAAIPANLIESQLFGHKRGSFTGADADHDGYFRQADGGTLFLDEIGELPLEGQAKLLRILEGHPFLPVGGTEEIAVDVRVIAATNRDLAEFVREKKFREDLFFRLTVFELVVPPLRDRGEDVDRLIDHFLDQFRRTHNRPQLELSDEARSRIKGYAWPGNVRQLRNVLDSAVVMADDPSILPGDLGIRDAGLSRLETLRIDQWEERLIRRALQRSGGSVPQAAKLLGISRATAYRKLTEYAIER